MEGIWPVERCFIAVLVQRNKCPGPQVGGVFEIRIVLRYRLHVGSFDPFNFSHSSANFKIALKPVSIMLLAEYSTLIQDDIMKNKIVLVTGSTDGIGKQTALDLAGMEATVLIHGKDTNR